MRCACSAESATPSPSCARGRRVAVLSSNDAAIVRQTVEQAGLRFDFYDTGSRALGKARALRKAMRRHSVQPSDVVYVGDELRDVEACRSAGVRMGGVAWGLTDAGALRASGIEVASTPQELPGLVDAAMRLSG
jgi:phosphoglycolate phosphatase